MAELVTDCPRCQAKSITLDVVGGVVVGKSYSWMHHQELMCVCRRCGKCSVIMTHDSDPGADVLGNLNKPGRALNNILRVRGPITVAHNVSEPAPDHVPEVIAKVFTEGACSLSTACYNAAGTMFRLCVDLATRARLPAEGTTDGPNYRQRRDLGLRLPWLFDNGALPGELRELAACIREDGNDGAHEGTLSEQEATDLLDFTRVLLESLYTLPERTRLAAVRRDERRAATGKRS